MRFLLSLLTDCLLRTKWPDLILIQDHSDPRPRSEICFCLLQPKQIGTPVISVVLGFINA